MIVLYHADMAQPPPPLGLLIIVLCLMVACTDADQSSDDRAFGNAVQTEVFQIGITGGLSRTPWTVAKNSDALRKIERRHGLRLELVNFVDEADAVSAYASDQIDGVTSTLNTLVGTLETASRDTRVVLLTDFSQRGYRLVSKHTEQPKDLAGEVIHVQMNTASHYFLFRVLEEAGLQMSDVELVDSTPAEILEGVIDGSIDTYAAGAPLIGQLLVLPEFREVVTGDVFSSEMVAGVAVAGHVLSDHPELGAALVGLWFSAIDEIMMDANTFSRSGLAKTSRFSGLPEKVV